MNPAKNASPDPILLTTRPLGALTLIFVVGKTSMIYRFITGQKLENMEPTIEDKFKIINDFKENGLF